MKRYLPFLLLCLCSNVSIAQKSKAKKTKKADSSVVVPVPPQVEEKMDESKIIDVVQQEGVKDEGYVVAPVEESSSQYYGSGPTGRMPLNDKTPLEATGKYFLIRVGTNSYSSQAKYGVQDSTGKVVLPTVYGSIFKSEDNYIAKLGSLYGVLDASFKVLIPFEFESIETVIGSRSIYILKRRTGGLQIVNKNGIPQLQGNYRYARAFYFNQKSATNYLALENANGKKAIYNFEKNKFEIDFVAKNFIPFETGVIVVDDTSNRIVDKNFLPITKETFTEVQASRNSSTFIVTKKNKKGLLSFTGKYILPCEYERIENTGGSLDLFIATKNGKSVCLDFLGKNILNESYDFIKPLYGSYSSPSLLLVKTNRKMGIKDVLNHTIVPIEFDTVYSNYGNCYIGQQAKKVMRYSLQGAFLNEVECDKVALVGYDTKIFYLNGKAGLLNYDFETMTKAEYDNIELLGSSQSGYYYGSSSRSNALRVTSNGKMGLIEKSGKLLLPIKYDLIEQMDNNTVLLKQNGKYGLARLPDCKVLAECEYDQVGNEGNGSSIKYIGIKGSTVTNISFN
jgi:hypothetical protein